LTAARLGYGSPAEYMAVIMRPFAWSWFTLYELDMLLAAAPILVDGTAATDPGVTADCTSPSIHHTSGGGSGNSSSGGGSASSRDPRVVFLRRNQGSVLLPLVIGGLQEP
ncbi:hypothetical protein Agub_g4099, partial [Astrephomene gubernaculifera]